jgi:hypothetical protein
MEENGGLDLIEQLQKLRKKEVWYDTISFIIDKDSIFSRAPMLWNFLHPQFTNVCNKPECLYLASLSNLA